MIKRMSSIVVLCLIFSAIGAQAFAQDGIKLQFKFVPNQLLRYKLNMVMNMTMQGGEMGGNTIPMNMTAVMRQRVKQVLPNGDGEIAMAYESMQMDAMGNSMPSDVSKMPVMTVTMSPSGAVKKIVGLEKMSGALANSGQFGNMSNFVTGTALPLVAVKVGDKWTQEVNFPMLGKFKVNSQLAANDATTATFKQNASGNFDASSTMPALAQMSPKGTLTMNSTVVFALNEGYLLKSQGEGNVQMSMDMPNGAGTMNMVSQMQMTMELLPDSK